MYLHFAYSLRIYPAETWRRVEVVMMSIRHNNIASTSRRRHFNVMCPPGILYIILMLLTLFLFVLLVDLDIQLLAFCGIFIDISYA